MMTILPSILCAWLEEKLGWCGSNEDTKVIMAQQW